jgi:hypothetical protein
LKAFYCRKTKVLVLKNVDTLNNNYDTVKNQSKLRV